MARARLSRQSDGSYRCEDPPLTIKWADLGGKRSYGVWIVTHDDDDEASMMAHTLDQVRHFLNALR